ncbi:MAG: autotransporter-associated beta strand repeat-containing protein [bacterium]
MRTLRETINVIPRQVGKLAVAAGLLALPTGQTARAATFTNTTADADYVTAANWSPNGVPSGSTGATIGDAGNTRSALYNSATSYTTTGDLTLGTLTGSTGTLTLASSARTLTYGRLIIGDGSSAKGEVTINGGTLAAPSGNPSGLIFGGGNAVASTVATLNLNVGGTLTIDHVQRYTGGSGTTPTYTFNFNGGTLRNASPVIDFLRDGNYIKYTVGAGGAVFDTSNGNATNNATLYGSGSDGGLTKTGDNALTLNNPITYTYKGPTTVNQGALILWGVWYTASALVINSNGVVIGNSNGNNCFRSFTNVTINGNGRLTTTNTCSATELHNLTLAGGTLAFDGPISAQYGTWGFNKSDGTVEPIRATGGTVSTISAQKIGAAFGNALSLIVDTNATLNVTGSIGGNSAQNFGLVKSGEGMLILAADTNLYANATTISNGVLLLNGVQALPGGIQAAGGTASLVMSGGVLGLGTNDFKRNLGTGAAAVQFAANADGGFAAFNADRIVNFNGDGHAVQFGSGNFLSSGSRLLFGHTSTVCTVTFSNVLNLAGVAQTVSVAGTSTATLAGVVTNGSLAKTGSGTLCLAAANTYSGATTVSNGMLLVNGSVSSTVTVVSNAVLGGTGTIFGAVANRGVAKATILAGGVSAPLTISGALDITGATLELAGTNNLASSGSTYTLIHTTGGVTGTFANGATVLPKGWFLSYRGGDIKVMPGYPGTLIRFF